MRRKAQKVNIKTTRKSTRVKRTQYASTQKRLRQRHGSGRHHTPPIVESRLRQRHGTGRHHTPSIVESQCKGKHKLQKQQCTFLHGRGKRKRRREAQGLADMSVRRSRATEDKAQRVATSRRCHHGPEALLPLLRSDRYMHAGFTSRSAEMSQLCPAGTEAQERQKRGSRATVEKKGGQQKQQRKKDRKSIRRH